MLQKLRCIRSQPYDMSLDSLSSCLNRYAVQSRSSAPRFHDTGVPQASQEATCCCTSAEGALAAALVRRLPSALALGWPCMPAVYRTIACGAGRQSSVSLSHAQDVSQCSRVSPIQSIVAAQIFGRRFAAHSGWQHDTAGPVIGRSIHNEYQQPITTMPVRQFWARQVLLRSQLWLAHQCEPSVWSTHA